MTEKVIYHGNRCDTIIETVDSHRDMHRIYEINIHDTESEDIEEVKE